MDEKVLFKSRTHFKVLFKPLAIQLLLVIVHVLVYMFFPHNTGLAWVDQWGQLTIHGIIVILELWYVIIPILRWWNSTFTLTNYRVHKNWGVLYKHSREITLDHVVSVTTERGIIDRIFGAGTLVFLDSSSSVAATNGPWNKEQKGYGVRFEDVPRIKEVEQLVQKARFNRA